MPRYGNRVLILAPIAASAEHRAFAPGARPFLAPDLAEGFERAGCARILHTGEVGEVRRRPSFRFRLVMLWRRALWYRVIHR